MDVNKVTLIGNLTQDPRSQTLPSGVSVASFTVATNHIWVDAQSKEPREAVDYHDISAWGRLTNVVTQYLKKGTKVYVEGRLRNRESTAGDGTRVRKSEITLTQLAILSPKPAGEKVEVRFQPRDPQRDHVAVRVLL